MSLGGEGVTELDTSEHCTYVRDLRPVLSGLGALGGSYPAADFPKSTED